MGGRRILTDEQLETVRDMRAKGRSPKQIAEHFASVGTKVSTGSVAWQALRIGADVPARLQRPTHSRPTSYMRNGKLVRSFTDEEDAELRRLDGEGVPYHQIGERMGRGHNSIRGRLLTLARLEARAEGDEC